MVEEKNSWSSTASSEATKREKVVTEMLSIQMLSSSKSALVAKSLGNYTAATSILAWAFLCPPPLWSIVPCANLRRSQAFIYLNAEVRRISSAFVRMRTRMSINDDDDDDRSKSNKTKTSETPQDDVRMTMMRNNMRMKTHEDDDEVEDGSKTKTSETLRWRAQQSLPQGQATIGVFFSNECHGGSCEP